MSLPNRNRRSAASWWRPRLRKIQRFVFEQHRLEHMVGPHGVWKESQAFQLSFLRARGLSVHDSLLDVGCGPLRGGVPLIEYLLPRRYAGIDVRPHAIAEAQRQIAKRGLAGKEPDVFVSTSFGRDELGARSFDVIWAFQVFYHLEDELMDECLGEVDRRLRPEGTAYANVNTRFPPGRWQEFPFVCRPVEFYEALGRQHGLHVQSLGELGNLGYTTKVLGHRNEMLRITRCNPPA